MECLWWQMVWEVTPEGKMPLDWPRKPLSIHSFPWYERTGSRELGNVLVDAVNEANTAIYKRNQGTTSSRPLDQMGTTVTTALVIGPHAFIANVGDSRTYLYRPGVGLRAITHDHSVVAELVASGVIAPDDVYTHPERNKILRCLGATPTVEVDVFYEQLQDGDILLCCSDGVWEMTRDPQIEQILSSSWLSAEHMAERLMHAALQGGGLDNIGLVVSQFQMNMTAMQTIVCPLPPSAASDIVSHPFMLFLPILHDLNNCFPHECVMLARANTIWRNAYDPTSIKSGGWHRCSLSLAS